MLVLYVGFGFFPELCDTLYRYSTVGILFSLLILILGEEGESLSREQSQKDGVQVFVSLPVLYR